MTDLSSGGSRRPWAPADAREAPLARWAPTAPWTSRSVEPDQDETSYALGFWGPAFIVFFQLTMLWLLVISL
ncbi:MAG: hypothetical protein ACK4SZ_10165 [Allosphingosinicella sp.]|uniref:hypothetical protein n=1 Tax=Allosphingosinicella sp. TaxID=2823234 RepID=UPI003955DBEE